MADRYKYLWDGSQPGWKLRKEERYEWTMTFVFSERGPSTQEIAALRMMVESLRTTSLAKVVADLRGRRYYTLERRLSQYEAQSSQREAERAGLRAWVEREDVSRYVPISPQGRPLFIEDRGIHKQVVDRMRQQGTPVVVSFSQWYERLPKNRQRADDDRTRKWLPPHFVRFGQQDQYQHSAGGDQRFAGAICPRCNPGDYPLVTILTLDTSDPRLRLDRFPSSSLPLLYCPECTGIGQDMTYRVQDQSVEVLLPEREPHREHEEQDEDEDECPAPVPNAVTRQPIALLPMPARLQQIFDRENAQGEVAESEEAEAMRILEEHGDTALWMSDVWQVGGRAIHIQGGSDPSCPYCAYHSRRDENMFFLAKAIIQEPWLYQLMYFVCTTCYTLRVEQYSD